MLCNNTSDSFSNELFLLNPLLLSDTKVFVMKKRQKSMKSLIREVMTP